MFISETNCYLVLDLNLYCYNILNPQYKRKNCNCNCSLNESNRPIKYTSRNDYRYIAKLNKNYPYATNALNPKN